MADYNAMTKTRPNSSESPAESPESMGSISRGVNASPSCYSDVLNASQTGYAKKEFIMMAPEEKLKHFNRRAQACEDNQEAGDCRPRSTLPWPEICFLSAPPSPLAEEAQSSFLEAEQVLEELHPQGGINQEEKMRTELEISIGLSRVYRRQNRPEDALRQCEKSLQVLKDCGKPEKTCSVYRDMAAIEQDKGHLNRAIEHLSKAHAIAMSHSPEELEGAQICHSLALLLSAAAEPRHNDSAGLYFEQSLSAYKHCAGPQDPAFLTAQDDFCRFLLLSDQQERCVEIQRASLATKRSTFGDVSAEVADTLQLIGSVEMSEGRVEQAHRTMTKCLEIQSLLYGSQHKKTKATQKAVDMLARAPEVAERQKRRGRRKTNQTQSVAPSAGNDGHSMSDS
ncbi:tetratricopeptide repeat protein 23 isoform X2 [Gymnodraco acuticeps]|uniref:Tetratricopeptide repeat protein 23 isoform X2 n=1 Tax=Gymnodraco acuticeps TaxID=8218 RepID=A0A6P8VGX1_GYMAC|nr:tetratricopeptide repeat protein 23 isoform X2 [Gymnodraco acuticeps]